MSAYVPGVCNIGPAEAARRRRSGIVGAVVSAVLLATLAATGAPKPARALVGLPAALAATGFLQAGLHFCSGFGLRGVFNFGDLGTTDTVEQAAYRAADRRKALAIVARSGGIGAAVGAAVVLLP